MPAFARDVLGLGEEAYGLLLGSSGVGALIGALSVAAIGHRFTPRALALGGVWIFSSMIMLFSFNRQLAEASSPCPLSPRRCRGGGGGRYIYIYISA